MPKILQLPPEILLQITSNLRESLKHPDPQHSLLNLGLVCKHLAPIARDELFQSPILRSCKVDGMLALLVKYPDLRHKVRSLTVETNMDQGICAPSKRIPRLKKNVLTACLVEIANLPISPRIQGALERAIGSGASFPFHGALICLLIATLPCIERLFLGGSVLYNFPMFRDLLCPDNEWVMLVQPRHKPRVASWELPNLSCMLLVLGPKLTVLELPNNFVLRNYGAVHKEVDGIARYFPNLKRLMVPADAVIGSSPMRNISRGLRELILTNGALTRLFTVWIRGVGRLKRKHSPHLSKISGLFLNAVLWLHVPLPIPGAIHRMSTDLQTIWRMMK